MSFRRLKGSQDIFSEILIFPWTPLLTHKYVIQNCKAELLCTMFTDLIETQRQEICN